MFYGKHKTNDLFYGTEHYSDPFIGTNDELMSDLQKYSRDAFYLQAIHAFPDEVQAEHFLEKLLTPEVYESEIYYNIKWEVVPGYTLSDETKRKMSEAQTGKVLPEETKQKISTVKSGTTWINNGITDKVHIPGEPIPDGWKQGRVFRKRDRKNPKKKKNVIAKMKNDIEESENELDKPECVVCGDHLRYQGADCDNGCNDKEEDTI